MMLIASLALGLLLIGRVRSYLRTGLRGELLVVVGIASLLLSFVARNFIISLVGIALINVGILILTTLELEERRIAFRDTNAWERIIGNISASRDQQSNRRRTADLSVPVGIASVILGAIKFYQAQSDWTELVVSGALAVGGIWVLISWVLTKIRH